jgi:broad specificity phosphatase PhoE
MTHKIILARHSETIWNEQLRYIGRTDLELSDLGRKHAMALAEHLSVMPVREIYASSMKRALETATLAAAGRDLTVRVEPNLREIDFGNWEGLTFNEIASAYPDLADIWIEDPYSVHIPGGESLMAFCDRVRNAWDATCRNIVAGYNPTTEDITLIVTHAGCIKIILGDIMGLDDRKAWQIYQDKGALNYIEVSRQGARVLQINDTLYREKS